MNNYSEWRQNKLYEGHINRLKAINNGTTLQYNSVKSQNIFKTPNKKHTKQSLSPEHSKKCSNSLQHNEEKDKKFRSRRLKTQSSGLKTKVEKMYFPAPLIPGQESKLIKAAINSKTMAMKEKEHLLENYLLSRRILSARTVIKTKEDKKDFKFHQKISNQLSRSQKIAQAYSTERQEKFNNFQKQMRSHIEIGTGGSCFKFKIKNALLIKGILSKDPKVLYNMTVTIGRKKYQAHALSYENLFTKEVTFRFKKGLLTSSPQVRVFLSVMRSNLEQQIGSFHLLVKDFDEEESRIYRIMKGKIPVGTIELIGFVTYPTANEVELPDRE